jgi:hypothetical protein
MQLDLDGDWRRHTRLLPKECEMIGVVSDHWRGQPRRPGAAALVRLAWSGALVKVTGGELTMLNQNRVRMKLELLEQQQYSPKLEMVEVESWKE